MKTKITVLFLFFFCCMNAQFNTLSFKPKTEVKIEPIVSAEDTISAETTNEKKSFFKRLFQPGIQKKQLKKELDSIKIVLNERNQMNYHHSLNIKRMEDSIVGLFSKVNDRILSEVALKEQKSEKKNKKLDFIKEKVNRMAMPVAGEMNITSYFGNRVHPILGTWKMHNGIDIAINYDYVYAIMDGVVKKTGWDAAGGGNYIVVQHNEVYETVYAHLAQVYYNVGEAVKGGFVIAKSGNSGNSTGPHLHFAVKEYGKYINPIPFLNEMVKYNQLLANF
ncbi:Glycyl-glycine endopeptidase ALE-1 precursor [Candidatus Ornithobacterium hominis]|uniref:Glycyl-glycine endopeptidase ALE-1 n=1 Tax=Candidatus Ornithobacterium hominis TaxID=2497989 RepID=A0A383U2Z7_9FLAO|nr:Glycyl-glycine endopeptidase ALE-1 precursor [Candidatus Ornithobacterium hominis]